MRISTLLKCDVYVPLVQSAKYRRGFVVKSKGVKTPRRIECIRVSSRDDGGDQRSVDDRGQNRNIQPLHGDDTEWKISQTRQSYTYYGDPPAYESPPPVKLISQ